MENQNATTETEVIADDLLRESLHRLYWKAMVKVVGEEKAKAIVDNLGKKEIKMFCECNNELIEHIYATHAFTSEKGYRCIECALFKPFQRYEIIR